MVILPLFDTLFFTFITWIWSNEPPTYYVNTGASTRIVVSVLAPLVYSMIRISGAEDSDRDYQERLTKTYCRCLIPIVGALGVDLLLRYLYKTIGGPFFGNIYPNWMWWTLSGIVLGCNFCIHWWYVSGNPNSMVERKVVSRPPF